jgi:glyoxylase-like metal-dependent hydrolase (beta-lactamase superfamily II)/rhodanese-related sulfurtransferase
MHFHQFYLGCLAHASYLVGDGGECAIVDPQRDVDQYLDAACQRGLAIKYVIETHLHADFVSGHRELAARSGAEIVFGAAARAEFPHRAVRDGDVLRVGNVELRAIETPGHTPESVCWLVDEKKLLTGDTLFIGDVGRPDLGGSAEALYDSLQKLLVLGDGVEVWPAHGAGSACGRNISNELSSTIGVQRRTNYALRPMPREEFVQMISADLSAPPPYFARAAALNRRGPRALEEIEMRALTSGECGTGSQPVLFLDVRPSDAFAAGHIAGAINIGLDGSYASWCGTLLSPHERIVIVADSVAQAREAVMRLARVGMENIAGYLDGGILAWADAGYPIAQTPQLSTQELRDADLSILDVRRPMEFAAGHVPGARNIPLGDLPRRLAEVDDAPLAVICASGYRSSAAVSLLARAGRGDLRNVAGGTAAWIRDGFAIER